MDTEEWNIMQTLGRERFVELSRPLFTQKVYCTLAPEFEIVKGDPIPAPGKVQLVALIRELWPTESTEFDDAHLLQFASHYTAGTILFCAIMVARHCRDRLEKRANGEPAPDDEIGQALLQAEKAKAFAEERARRGA